MHVVVVLDGEPPTAAELGACEAADHVIAADGGGNHLARAGLDADLVVGDLDSLEPEACKELEARGARFEEHPVHKDETDGELAVAAALALAPERITFIGAHGRRTAMFLSNVELLRRCHEAGVEAEMIGQGERVLFVGPGAPLELASGTTLNVLPTEATARLTLEGTTYDVARLVLRPGTARGVSNPVLRDGRLTVHEGLVLAVVEGAP